MNRKVEEFVRLALERVAPKAAKAARDNLWNALNAEEKKQTNESLLFISFASATRLVPDPFEHINANSPRPDIRTSIGGHDYYFELGEITDEDLARGISNALKTKAVSGCAISQVEPLLKMLTQKCQKHYVTYCSITGDKVHQATLSTTIWVKISKTSRANLVVANLPRFGFTIWGLIGSYGKLKNEEHKENRGYQLYGSKPAAVQQCA